MRKESRKERRKERRKQSRCNQPKATVENNLMKIAISFI